MQAYRWFKNLVGVEVRPNKGRSSPSSIIMKRITPLKAVGSAITSQYLEVRPIVMAKRMAQHRGKRLRVTVGYWQLSNCKIRARGTLPSLSLSFPLLFSSPPLPSFLLPFPFSHIPSLWSRLLKIQLEGLGERCKLPLHAGSGVDPSRQTIWCMWHLVATILIIFLKINWPNFVHFTITKHSNEPKPRHGPPRPATAVV